MRTLLPTPIPAKARLLATLRECERIVGKMPEPLCMAIEQSNVMGSWRSQLLTLLAMSDKVKAAWNVIEVLRKPLGG